MDPEPIANIATHSDKSNARKKFPGKGAQNRRQESYRKATNVSKLEMVRAKLNANKFDDVADEIALNLQSLRMRESHVEAEIPATTRGIGFAVHTAFETATSLAPPAAAAAEVDMHCAYRVALLHHQVQQQQANLVVRDRPKAGIELPAIQHEELPQDVVIAVKSVTETFSNVATIIESFGRIKFNNKTFRTYQPPHLSEIIDEEPRVQAIRGGRQRRAAANAVNLLMPNPYAITITSLRNVVNALADDFVPLAQRNYFIARNPIPGAMFNNGILQNPDDIIQDNYIENELYRIDLRRWRSFIGSCQRRMATLIRPVSLSGEANVGALTTIPVPPHARIAGYNVQPPGAYHVCSFESLTQQQLILGGYSLTGENPEEEPGVQIERSGFGAREPSFQALEMEFQWQAVDDLVLTKR